jgi:hypothetical protein
VSKRKLFIKFIHAVNTTMTIDFSTLLVDNTSLHFLYISTLEIFVHNNTILYCNCLTVNIVNKEAALNLV